MTLPAIVGAVPVAVADHAPTAAAAALDFAEVYRRHFAFVFRTVRRLGVPREGIDDAVQEVFLVVHKNLAQFEARSSVTTWLFGIVVNVARRRRRDHARKGAHEPLPEVITDPASAHDPHEAARKAEAARFLYRFLEGLDGDKREVFVLHEIEQLSAAQIAPLVGAPVQTVYSRLHAARQAFERAVARHRAREKT